MGYRRPISAAPGSAVAAGARPCLSVYACVRACVYAIQLIPRDSRRNVKGISYGLVFKRSVTPAISIQDADDRRSSESSASGDLGHRSRV